MKLERLHIERLPGLAKGFVLEGLCEGVNLVTAPNAFGKSSLIRALGHLLRDPKRDDPPVSLAADFTDGDTTWQATRTGRQVTWQRNGASAPRPPLPNADELGRFWLSMETLIAANAQDERLATELMRDLRGGFDLGKARLPLKPRHGAQEVSAWREARKALLKAEHTAKQLSTEQDRLPEIEQAIDRARKAEDLYRQIETAKHLAGTVAESKSLADRLEEFPQGMEGVVGIDPKALETLSSRIETSREKIREAQQARAEAEDRLKAARLSSDELPPAESALEATIHKANRLDTERNRLARQEDEAARQTTRVREASKALGGTQFPELNRDSLQLAEGFAASLLSLKAEEDTLTTKIKLAGKAPDDEEVKQHDRGVDALRDWLNAEALPFSARAINWLMLLAFATAFAALGASALHPALGPICAGVSLIAIGFAWWRLQFFGAFGKASGNQGLAERQAAEKRFAATGLQTPTWDGASVRSALKALDVALAKLIAQRSLAEGAEELQTRLKTVQTVLQEKAAQRTRIAESIGFDPAMPLTELDRFIRLVKDWDEASLSLAETNAEIEQSKTLIEKTVNEISDLLRPWQEGFSSDLDKLAAEVEAFGQRLKSAKAAAQALDREEQALARLHADVEERETDRAMLYEKANVENGDEAELVRRLALRDDWIHAIKRLEAAKVREAQDLKALDGAPQLVELAKAPETSDLEALLEEARTSAEALDARMSERSEIMAEIKQAEAGSNVQTAVAKVAESLAALEVKRDERLQSDATDLLLTEVETAYTTQHQPQVLAEADRLFRQVTAHEFALALGEQGAFEARDLRQNARRTLEELSTGTRMQLLLAVRMAWVQARGQGALALPIFLDEALTTSDEQRFMEVARTLHGLAQSTGTQVVYLSARRHEAALWQAATGEAPNCIDLEAERQGAERDQATSFELAPREEIPKPAGSASEYAKVLGVPGIHPHRDAGDMHLFHLLRDELDLVHRLMDLYRIRSLGQVESMLSQSAARIGDSDWQTRLATRCRAARAWTLACRQGRGRPLEIADLEASAIMSDAFLGDARELLASAKVAGDASAFLDALKRGGLKGFRKKTIDALEGWLRDNRFIDDSPTLSSAERLQQVHAAFGAEEESVLADVNRCVDWLETGLEQALEEQEHHE